MAKISEIDSVIAEVAGEDVIPLVKKLKNKKNVSEFKLADSLKQEINIVRNMLYRLYNSNLVSFTRKKDKKKGWYIYYWTFDTKRIKYLMQVLKEKRLEKLRERLEREQSEQFFLCPNLCIRLDFEQSMNFEFKCPECGTLIEVEDNSKKIQGIQEEISCLEKEMAEKHLKKKPAKTQSAKVKKEEKADKKKTSISKKDSSKKKTSKKNKLKKAVKNIVKKSTKKKASSAKSKSKKITKAKKKR